MTQSGTGYRAMRSGWRWTVRQRFNMSVDGTRQGGLSGFSGGGSPDGLGRLGWGSAHSGQLRRRDVFEGLPVSQSPMPGSGRRDVLRATVLSSLAAGRLPGPTIRCDAARVHGWHARR